MNHCMLKISIIGVHSAVGSRIFLTLGLQNWWVSIPNGKQVGKAQNLSKPEPSGDLEDGGQTEEIIASVEVPTFLICFSYG